MAIYDTELKLKANSKPISPSPVNLLMGPLNQACDMPNTVPATPKQMARVDAIPGGNALGLV